MEGCRQLWKSSPETQSQANSLFHMKAKQRETLTIEEDNLQFFKAEDFSVQHNIQICENQTMLRMFSLFDLLYGI